MVSRNAVRPSRSDAKVSVDTIWSWLEDVPDPEIPVLSVVDLGIVRDVEWDGDTLVVALTPTYSGCPAISVIAMDVEAELVKKGVRNVRIETRLSPAWTTDWIGPEAHEKMRVYGIAPPLPGSCIGSVSSVGQQDAVECPRCESMETERISHFGSTPCKAAWRCTSCLEPFDYFKPI
jgi:ring-1,2-phenylacetyl-CoA epoxidase subunit PaaD